MVISDLQDRFVSCFFSFFSIPLQNVEPKMDKSTPNQMFRCTQNSRISEDDVIEAVANAFLLLDWQTLNNTFLSLQKVMEAVLLHKDSIQVR